jgi:hypothetical protein
MFWYSGELLRLVKASIEHVSDWTERSYRRGVVGRLPGSTTARGSVAGVAVVLRTEGDLAAVMRLVRKAVESTTLVK